MNVHILVTCRNPELKAASMLVFDTLRVGFPTAHVTVWLNRLAGSIKDEVIAKCKSTGVNVFVPRRTIHHEWIKDLVQTQDEPFYICDTDIVFWSAFEQWKFAGPIAGRFLPEFDDDFTGCRTKPRVHPSLCYIDPYYLKQEIGLWQDTVIRTEFSPSIDLFNPVIIPSRPKSTFYDTLGMLTATVPFQVFCPEHLECYDHLFCGTIADMVAPRMTQGENLVQYHKRLMANPELMRGLHEKQDKYFEHFKPKSIGGF